MKSLDRHWYLDVNTFSRHTGWAHGFVSAFALWGGLVVLVLMVIGAWLWSRRENSLEGIVTSTLAGVSALVALGINHFLSQAVARTRPCHVFHHAVHILSCASDYSFPSDHAIIAGALAMGLLIFSRRLGLFAVLVALFLAFSRVYAGVHYPGDVIAGLLLGALIALVIWVALRRVALDLALRLTRTPLRPLLAGQAASRT
jgi:membrane-associated phospholipid phosphatase